MQRTHGLGLRAQIILALSAAFLISFAALGVVVVQVAQRAQELERTKRSLASAESIAVALQSARDRDPSRAMLARLVGRADIIGVSLREPGESTSTRVGQTQGKPTARTTLASGADLALWLTPLDAEGTSPLGRFLRLYLALTFFLILLTAYVALTRLIVRPVEDLTRASERLATGTLDAGVPVGGAAEVARLAVSFNRMARELKTEKLALEARLGELERATRDLRSAQDQLIRSEKLASIGRLSAGVAHEIGNPLAAILGLVELMQLGGLNESEQAEFLRRVRNEVERIHHTIRDLLDYSRAQPAATGVDAVTADLVAVVEEAVKLVAPQKDLRHVTIERRFENDLGAVRGAPHELTQLLLNLLLNAADAVAGDGDILIDLKTDGRDAVLSVSDTGPGIPEQLRDKLFEPFVTTKPVGKGTGLGLAVCQAIVERVGGSISAENRTPHGACFRVRLPRKVPGALSSKPPAR